MQKDNVNKGSDQAEFTLGNKWNEGQSAILAALKQLGGLSASPFMRISPSEASFCSP